MTHFTLVLFSWTLEALHMDGVTTFGTSIPVSVCTLGIKLLSVLCLLFVRFTALLFVVRLFWFLWGSSLLVFTGWQFCSLMP